MSDPTPDAAHRRKWSEVRRSYPYKLKRRAAVYGKLRRLRVPHGIAFPLSRIVP